MSRAPTFGSDRAARAFVAAVWVLMVVQCGWIFFRYARNIPITEDWILVSGLTGHDPHFWRSLWAQNNEHREPFPQLVLQGVLRAGGGDFRAGMVFNVALAAAAAALLVHLARTVRGRASYADAFFPLAFLHLGNWENLFWTWQATQIIPAILDIVLIYLLVRAPALATIGAATVAGLSLVLMPLSGANGLFFVPFIGAWFCFCAWRQWRAGARGRPLAPAGILVAATGAAGIIAVLYFVGYVRPEWVPENPGKMASLAAGIHFLSLAFGPVARSSWILSGLGLFTVLGSAIWVTVTRLRELAPDDRHRAHGLLAFAGTFVLFGLIVGWGRAAAIAIYGSWPLRYTLIALPILVVAFFLWTLYAPARRREWMPGAMMVAMIILTPLNTVHGFWWSQWYIKGTTDVIADLAAGSDAATMVERHHTFLHHSRDRVDLANEMLMLKAAHLGPWVALRDDATLVRPARPPEPIGPERDGLVAEEIRYQRGGVLKAALVWGIDGWRPLPPAQWPAGTEIRRGMMQTAMTKVADRFVATVRAPSAHPLQYGFLVTGADGRVTWDGDYEAKDLSAGLIEVAAKVALPSPATDSLGASRTLVATTVRYPSTLGAAGFLVWGVNGWYSVPQAVRPGRTTVANGLMKTTLVREGDDLVARIDAPAGATLDYGATLTHRRGLFDFVRPVWDGSDDHPRIVAGTEIRAKSAPLLPDPVGEVVAAWPALLQAVSGLLILWGVGFLILGITAPGPAPIAR